MLWLLVARNRETGFENGAGSPKSLRGFRRLLDILQDDLSRPTVPKYGGRGRRGGLIIQFEIENEDGDDSGFPQSANYPERPSTIPTR